MILEALVCFYWLLEMYVFVYCQEAQIKLHQDHFERLAKMEIESDCILPETAEPLVSPIKVEAVQYSQLDQATEVLFEDLQRGLETVDVNPFAIPELDEITYYANHQDSMDMDMMLSDYDDDCIQLADLDEYQESKSTGYEKFASAKIADDLNGPQKWVVTVVGTEETYLHVSDGKRIWINIGEQAYKLTNGDVLSLEVIRSDKEITVEKLILLETTVSSDYVIPDETYYYEETQIAI